LKTALFFAGGAAYAIFIVLLGRWLATRGRKEVLTRHYDNWPAGRFVACKGCGLLYAYVQGLDTDTERVWREERLCDTCQSLRRAREVQ
jgi:hypothetical protein